MGYCTERFVGSVKEGLLCCICQEVLEEPLQAGTCEHAYCRTCIHAWLFQQHTCPQCRAPLHSNQLRPLFRYMKNDLEQLQLQCGHPGCLEVVSMERIRQHESRDCTHRPLPDPSGPRHCPTCAQYVASEAELQRHLATECAFRELAGGVRECPHGCGMELVSEEDREHSCVAELRTAVELVRAELLCRLGEQREETERRLGTERRAAARREQAVRAHLADLRQHLLRLQRDVAELRAEGRRKEKGKSKSEEEELVERLARLSRQCSMDPANM